MFVVLFIISILGQPAMQAATRQTWATLEACEADIQAEGVKFAAHMRGLPAGAKISAECIENPSKSGYPQGNDGKDDGGI